MNNAKVNSEGDQDFRRNCRVIYFRKPATGDSKKGHPIGSLAYKVDRDAKQVIYEVMTCNPNDTFDRKIAYRGAITRLQRSPFTAAIVEDSSTHDILYKIMYDIVNVIPDGAFPRRIVKAAKEWMRLADAYEEPAPLYPSNYARSLYG